MGQFFVLEEDPINCNCSHLALTYVKDEGLKLTKFFDNIFAEIFSCVVNSMKSFDTAGQEIMEYLINELNLGLVH